MRCTRCGCSLQQGESFRVGDKVLCEDCYMYESNPPRACDPMAVASALSIRKQLGQEGDIGLSEQQKKIYCLVRQKGITKQELASELKLKSEVLEAEFAILRHCELVRAHKEGDKVYVTLW